MTTKGPVTLLLGYSDPKLLLLTWAGPRRLLLPAPAGVRAEVTVPLDPSPTTSLRASVEPPARADRPASAPQKASRSEAAQRASAPSAPSVPTTPMSASAPSAASSAPSAASSAPPPASSSPSSPSSMSMPAAPAPRPLKAQRSTSLLDETPPPPPSRPRPPEVQLDPRTAFRRAGQASRVARPTEPRVAPNVASDAPVADLIIVPQAPSFRASEQGVKAVLGYLRNSQILAARAEQQGDDGVLIHLLPDAFSHLAFSEGQAPPGAPSIAEGTLWFGPKPQPLPFGDPARQTCFRLVLTGCRFPRVAEAFLARLQQILYLRPEVVAAPHDPARLRTRTPTLAAQPIPHFDLQEFDP